MILFADDWKHYPSATIHTQTRNTSFLRMAQMYKNMGIKNHAFHLTLLQPHLADVDPHDPNLSTDLMIDIGMECKWNPWYFFREIFRVPPQASMHPLQFRANRGNMALYWLFFNHIDVALIQPRQTGKSLSTDGLMANLIYVSTQNTRINLLTKDDELRKANIDRLKDIRKYLPPYLVNLQKDDSDNKEELTCKAKNNKYKTAVGQKSLSAAGNLGRGLTSPILHIDEPPFIDFMDQVFPTIMNAGNAARDEAAAFGACYGTILTTTAGKKDTRSGRYMYDMIHSGMVWTEKIFDCKDRNEALQMIKRNCLGKKLIVNATFSHRQLGYTDEWAAQKIAESNSDPDTANRDMFNVWTAGGLKSALSIEINELIRSSEREPEFTEITDDLYIIRWYIKESELNDFMNSTVFVCGLDSSEAIGRDSITLIIQDVRDLSVVGAVTLNETNLIRVGLFVAKLMIRFQKIILIPERRSSGQTIIDTLLLELPKQGIDPFKRIYNLIVDEHLERPDDWKTIQYDMGRRPQSFLDTAKKYFGFATSGSGKHSRNVLYSEILTLGAKSAGKVIYDKPLISEILTLEVKNGRVDHGEDGHDDHIIAWMLGVWFLTRGKNLRYYGIENPLSHVRAFSKNKSVEQEEEEEYEREVQLNIRQEIEQLFDDLKNTRDDAICMQIENRIRVLDRRLKEQFTEGASIDALIRDAEATRVKQVREAHWSTGVVDRMYRY